MAQVLDAPVLEPPEAADVVLDELLLDELLDAELSVEAVVDEVELLGLSGFLALPALL